MTRARTRAKAGTIAGRRPLKTAEVVALEIVRDIVGDGLQPGAPLPLEAEMLAKYRVSRSSLREAMRLLETQGLVAIRPGPGAGTVVGDAAPYNLGRTMTLHFHMANTRYDELLEGWEALEALLADLAARNPDAAARRRAMEPFLASDAATCHQSISSGLGFHDAIADLAGNRAMATMVRAIAFIVSDQVLANTERHELEAFIIDEHSALAQAVIDGQADDAVRLMRRHVAHLIDDFKACWPDRIGDRVEWR